MPFCVGCRSSAYPFYAFPQVAFSVWFSCFAACVKHPIVSWMPYACRHRLAVSFAPCFACALFLGFCRFSLFCALACATVFFTPQFSGVCQGLFSLQLFGVSHGLSTVNFPFICGRVLGLTNKNLKPLWPARLDASALSLSLALSVSLPHEFVYSATISNHARNKLFSHCGAWTWAEELINSYSDWHSRGRTSSKITAR